MQITFYTAPGCGPCLALKRALERAGLSCQQIDLSQDAGVMERVKAFSYRQAPVVVVERAGQEALHRAGLRPEMVAVFAKPDPAT